MANSEAGVELDHKMAIEIMGWVENEGGIGYTTPNGQRSIEYSSFGHFEPSTCIDSAWEVLEHCGLFDWFDYLTKNEDGKYTFVQASNVGSWPEYYDVAADTVPMAICKAALWVKENG